jgi:hypothetical protein
MTSRGTNLTTHNARITGPVAYLAPSGTQDTIPLGPCLVEQLDAQWVDIIWGTQGQSSAALPVDAVRTAQHEGHLVLLD